MCVTIRGHFVLLRRICLKSSISYMNADVFLSRLLLEPPIIELHDALNLLHQLMNILFLRSTKTPLPGHRLTSFEEVEIGMLMRVDLWSKAFQLPCLIWRRALVTATPIVLWPDLHYMSMSLKCDSSVVITNHRVIFANLFHLDSPLPLNTVISFVVVVIPNHARIKASVHHICVDPTRSWELIAAQ